VQEGDWLMGLAFFVLVNIGANGSIVFYDALLPHVARPDEVDRVSTGAFAVGYLGAGLLLAFCLLLIQMPGLFGLPEGTLPARLSFLAVAFWWAVFSIPLFFRVAEPRAELAPEDVVEKGTLRFALNRMRTHLPRAALLPQRLPAADRLPDLRRRHRHDHPHGSRLRRRARHRAGHMIGAIVMVQFVGVPFSFLFGMLAGWIGTKRAIFLGLLVYTGDLGARLLHDHRAALLGARLPGRHGAGRHAGALPLALLQHDPGVQVRRALRLLRRDGQVRRACSAPR
jgi:MFS transporter, UMF1 family